jgi:hypothetical protein
MAAKHGPAAPYPPRDEARRALQTAIERPEARRALSVALTISGGLPADRYELRFESRGTGEVSCGLATGATRGPLQMHPARLADDEFGDLLQRMRLADLVQADLPMPRIPPDSLVGRLTLSAGGEPLTIYFMADPGQARDAGQPPPPPLAAALSAIYGVCARVLGNRWKAP